MVTEKMIEAAKLFDAMSPDESIGAFGGSGQWVELCTVRDLRKLEAALSTDAEPVGVRCTGCGSSWTDEDLTREKGRNPKILSCCPERKTIPVYAAPSVAVKALEFYANPRNWIDTPSWDSDPECITPKAIPVTDEGDGSRPCDCGETARAAIAALSAQVQDVAEYERHAEYLETMADVIMDSGKAGKLEAKLTMEKAAKFIRSMIAAAPAAKLEEKP